MDERGIASGLEWSDLAVVLAIARAGSLSGAGRLLRCSHTTVYRRINAIEERARVRFFERLPSGYVMTDAGEVTMRCAERIETELLGLSREILGRDARVQGTVVVTGPEGVVTQILPPLLTEFRLEHPDVNVKLLAGAASLDLTRREADIAIRATRKPPDESLGRRICDFRFGAYAHRSYIDRAGERPLTEHDIVALEGTPAWMVPQIWKTVPKAQERVVFEANRIRAVVEAARAGMGAALLPFYLGEPEPELERLRTAEHLDMALWILTHPALRHTARVKVLMGFLTEKLKERAALFAGG